ncbi:MAG: hypothetical protein ACE5GD_06300 [Candidatus Geothermarchaeales archaeon]
MAGEYAKKIEYLAKPFIELGIYDSPEKFLRDVVRELARNKIKNYERTVRRFEEKYKASFEEFTKRIEGKATPKLEDDWMRWEAALNMLLAWRKAREEIDVSAA